MAEAILVLRTCGADGKSSHGFVWPRSGPVAAPDWQPTNECGHGLHALPWGEGGGGFLDWHADALWQVVEVSTDADNYRAGTGDLARKCKFRRGTVVLTGSRAEATQYLYARAPAGTVVAGLVLAVGDGGTVTGGDSATVTGGHDATVTGGDSATVTGGYDATVTGGDGALLEALWWDAKANRCRRAVAYVGEDGIEPNVPYRWDAAAQAWGRAAEAAKEGG